MLFCKMEPVDVESSTAHSMQDEPEPLPVVFLVGEKRVIVKVPHAIFIAFEIFVMSLGFKEGQSGKFEFRFPTTIEAIKAIFDWKKKVISNSDWIPDPEWTMDTWVSIMTLAHQLQEMTFFDDFDKMPVIMDIVDHVPNLPPEIMSYYFEDYIRRCFYPVCHCRACWNIERFSLAKEWIHSLPFELQEFWKGRKSFYVGFNEFVHGSDIDDVMNFTLRMPLYLKERWEVEDYVESYHKPRYSFTPADEVLMQRRIIVEMYFLSNEQLDNIKYYIEAFRKPELLPSKCPYDGVFHVVWTEFCEVYPEIAKLIWECADRASLLESTNVSKKKWNTMMKLQSFEDLIAYIKRCKPKPVDDDLLILIRNGDQRKLQEYRRAKQKQESKEAVKRSQELCYTGRIVLISTLRIQGKGTLRKKMK